MEENSSMFHAHTEPILKDREYREKLIDNGLLSPEIINASVTEHLAEAASHLESAYRLLLVHGVLHVDRFLKSKSDLHYKAGLPYGYLSAMARNEHGTNTFRFFKRTPNGSVKTGFDRKFITMPANGYTRGTLSGHASHSEELSLALMLEDRFTKLRSNGKKIKYAARLLNDVLKGSSFKPKPIEVEDDEAVLER